MTAKILVVDDEEGIRFSFNLFLTEDGYQVSTAATYGEAIDLIEKTALRPNFCRHRHGLPDGNRPA